MFEESQINLKRKVEIEEIDEIKKILRVLKRFFKDIHTHLGSGWNE